MVKTDIIDQNWLNKKNPKADQPIEERCLEYTGKSIGAFRILQTLQKSLRLGGLTADAAGYKTSSTLKQFDANLGIGAGALGFPRLPSATASAIKALSDLKEDDGIPMTRKMVKAVRDVAEAIAAYGFCSIFIKANPTVLAVAQATDFTSDVMDLQISASDYYKSSELETIATGDKKVALTHSKKYYLLRVAKAVLAVAGTIFGFTLLALGASLLPFIVLTIVSLSSVLFAIARDLYKESGTYPVIEFDREVRI